MKPELLEEVREFLVSGGFDVFEYPRGCFDIAARRSRFLLLKVLTNVDSFQKRRAKDLKLLSDFLDSECFILGKRTRRQKLKDSVVYERFGIPAMTPGAFKSVMDGDYPEKFRTRGGLYGAVEPEKLRKARKKREMTQEELADILGVSQKNISEHESGKELALFSMVEALKNILGEDVSKGIDPVDVSSEKHVGRNKRGNKFCRILEKIGFKAGNIRKAPPELVAKSERTILSRRYKDNVKETKILAEFSKVSGSKAFMLSKDKVESKKVPVLSMDEVKKVDSSDELLKIVDEKSVSA